MQSVTIAWRNYDAFQRSPVSIINLTLHNWLGMDNDAVIIMNDCWMTNQSIMVYSIIDQDCTRHPYAEVKGLMLYPDYTALEKVI